ncbi:MAG: hypothetical protein QNK37_13080 [Acidobacteriota bacterium]|nr:hypothetical protein [Acidobacteriota bacterium]
MPDKKTVNHAFKFYHERKFEKAAEAFGKLLADDSLPIWQRTRFEQFHKIVKDFQNPAEEQEAASLKMVSYHLNRQEFDKAEAVIENLSISEDARQYLLAEIRIEQGKKHEAVNLLQRAVDKNEDNAGYALNSPSFAEVLKEDEFLFLRSEII